MITAPIGSQPSLDTTPSQHLHSEDQAAEVGVIKKRGAGACLLLRVEHVFEQQALSGPWGGGAQDSLLHRQGLGRGGDGGACLGRWARQLHGDIHGWRDEGLGGAVCPSQAIHERVPGAGVQSHATAVICTPPPRSVIDVRCGTTPLIPGS
jgi:hypothetical protein